MSMKHPAKEATPEPSVFTGFVVQASVPLLGLVLIEIVTGLPETRLLNASLIVTAGCVAQTALSPPPPGCVEKLAVAGPAALTEIVEEFDVFVPSVTSLAVTVLDPAVFNVTENVLVPPTRAALAGRVALASEDVIEIVWVELTGFQFASTA